MARRLDTLVNSLRVAGPGGATLGHDGAFAAAWPGRTAAVVALSVFVAAFIGAAALTTLERPTLSALPFTVKPVLRAPEAPVSVSAPAVAAPARGPWQPPQGAVRPFIPQVERWRPMARELLAEAWSEGRLDGKAAILDDDMVLSIIEHESAGNPTVTSWAGAIGLMQVMPFTFAEMHTGSKANEKLINPAAMWDVPSNMRAGIRYLALALQAHEGNRYWAAASYNGGIEAVAVWRAAGLYAVPPVGGYVETANYAQKVTRTYLRHRPEVTLAVPDPMPASHVPGAMDAIRRVSRSW